MATKQTGRPKTFQQINSFVAGLITEATELTFPPNASYDELNCVLSTKGSRRRRLGIDFEGQYVLSSTTWTDTQLTGYAISNYSWLAVGSNGNLNFCAVQVGDKIYFYDFSFVPLSGGLKTFSIDLSAHLAPASAVAYSETVTYASGRGDLYITSPQILPLQVKYDSDTDSIVVSEIAIRIRDLQGVDDGLAVDFEPDTLSNTHKYNLYNQGWYPSPDGQNNLNIFNNACGLYPANNVQWTSSKASNGTVNTTQLRRLGIGTTQAPRGHFILDPFYKDRSAVSGISGLPVEQNTNRPSTVAFYAGRACFAQGSDVYISQVLSQSRDNAGKCYQDADPTSEIISDLIDTDGLVLPIPEAGTILHLQTVANTLVVFANNGVWSIGGTDGGFKATAFSVNQITAAGVLSRSSIVDVDGTPFWWSDTGIYTVNSDKVSGLLSAASITDSTIKSYYLNITSAERERMQGRYDPANKTIVWLFRDQTMTTSDTPKHYYTRVLVFDILLSAFYPWDIGSLPVNSPYICGIVRTPTLNRSTEQFNVIEGTTNVLSGLNNVVAGVDVTLGNDTFITYLTMVPSPSDATNRLSFSLFSNILFTDWQKYGIILGNTTGANYSSYVETGFELSGDLVRFKDDPYVIIHCKRTETGITVAGGTDTFTRPSSCFMRAKWEWSSGSQSGKWSTRQQAYRLKDLYIPNTTTPAWDNGFRVTTTRLRVRGSGRAVQFRFESESGKDFELLGWGVVISGNTDV